MLSLYYPLDLMSVDNISCEFDSSKGPFQLKSGEVLFNYPSASRLLGRWNGEIISVSSAGAVKKAVW